MKKLLKTLLFISLLFSFNISFGEDIPKREYEGFDPGSTKPIINEYDKKEGEDRNIDPLEKMKRNFYATGEIGEDGIYNFLIKIAKDFKNIMFTIVLIYFFVMVFRLIYSGKTEEEFNNLKKGVIWLSVGLIVMQSAYSIAVTLYQPRVDAKLGELLLTNIIGPIIQLLLFLSGFLFLAMMIYSAYIMVTARGEEEKMTKGKNGVIYAVMGFILIKISGFVVEYFYGDPTKCPAGGSAVSPSCLGKINIRGASNVIFDVVNWINTFIIILITVFIIYAGGLMLTSGGDEEKMKRGKNLMFYVLIGVFIVSASYTITIFFINPAEGI